MPLSLIRPTPVLETDFCETIAEFRALREDTIESFFSLHNCDFRSYLLQTQLMEAGRNLPKGYVASTTYWSVLDNKRIIGICRFRHDLTPALRIEGGHIGYSIRPSERKKGYGTQQLALILAECRQLGYKKVMITCDWDNIGSYKIIESNGGVRTGEALSPTSKKRVYHYWVQL
ncbi:MAG: GNAT family N-acetyltransferase [Chloroflexi bacterium HGW-Chloroflexi-10]|nr:MAG: GNAT family N-acetyltransferase [Chloroflexi bacterium HGW-Chloroflexi-10]